MRHSGSFRIDRSRLALVAGLAVDNYGSGLFLPLALVYAVRIVDLSVDVAGVIVAIATALGLAVPAVAGRLTHRVGREPSSSRRSSSRPRELWHT